MGKGLVVIPNGFDLETLDNIVIKEKCFQNGALEFSNSRNSLAKERSS